MGQQTDSDLHALRLSEERLQAFMQHSPALAFMKDAQGRYVYVNACMAQVFGISPAQIYGKADVDWLPEAAARTVQQNDRTVFATGQMLEVVETVPTSDGDRQWLVNKFLFANAVGEKFVGGVAMDITSLKLAEARLRQSEERYRQLVENSQGLICTHDMEGRLLTINPAALNTLGYVAEEVVGRNLRDLLIPAMREHYPRYLERINHTGEDSDLMLVQTKDGRERTWQYHNVRIHDAGHAPYVLGHAQDVTELREAQEQLRTLSVTDELTGLWNRRGFFRRAAHLLRSTLPPQQSFTVVYADVDHLKTINDNFGHDLGSAAIVAAAEVLKQTFRAADVLARLGGDEFVVLAQVPREATSTIISRFEYHLAGVNAQGDLPLRLSVSLGVSHLEVGSSATLEDLVRLADQNMYEQKRAKALDP